ncbi:solute carrier family 10 member 6-like [Myripristis murdjan]|uniref:solute carrier family 10 member 6-like n=1 Tax=Myripristis murdjan TaxID=586833 RepID=UPI001175CD19|nr:solute carrier family 10 member 6-like [Myripristis murdjan]
MLNNSSLDTTVGNGSLVDEPGGLGSGLHRTLSVVLTIMLAMVVFSLGCTVEVPKLWFHLRKPWGILVGFICQFGLMPLTAYLLATGFGVQPVQAVAVIIMGCCPGGIISNIITYWLDGDMDLSITMTSCSTVLGMGMMPLCLYIYTHSWVEAGSIKIPYFNIGITLITLVVPVACGVAVNYKWPKAAKMILRVGSVVGGLLLLVVGLASALLYRGSWYTDSSLLIIGSVFPLIGYSISFIIAVVLRQPWPRCRTIAMETGAQNVQICSTMLQLSFPPEQLIHMFTFPLIYGSFQLLNGLLLVTAYQIYKQMHLRRTADASGQELQTAPGVDSGHGEINMGFENDHKAVRTAS